MTDTSKFFQKLDSQIVQNANYSVLVDEIYPREILVIVFGHESFDSTPGFDFYSNLKTIQNLTSRKANLILLRDKTNSWYQRGVDGLGSNIDETIVSLKKIISKINPSQIITIGQSMGAYAAIHYGALLAANKAIAFGPLSFLDVAHANKISDHRWIGVMEALEKDKPKGYVPDLAEFLKKKAFGLFLNIVFGGKKDDIAPNLDLYHASRLNVDANSVDLLEFAQSPHAVVKFLIDNKLIDKLLANLILQEDLTTLEYDQPQEIDMNIKLDAVWSKWVQENYNLGVPLDVIKETLLKELDELSPAEAEIAINNALSVQVNAEQIAALENIKKREWLLNTLDSQFRAKNKYNEAFERTDLPDYKTFLHYYYYENKPGLFRGAAKNWAAMNWTPLNLKDKVGNPVIEVQSGRSKDERYEENGAKYKTKMNFHDFIDKVLSLDSSNDLYLTANNAGASNSYLAPMFKDISNIGDGYMDMQKVNNSGFMWIGPKGTFTQSHHDLTNNLFVQIYGSKRFWLIPSTQVAYTYNNSHVYSPVDPRNPDYAKYPDMKKVTIMQFDVHPGDFLFIPIGWLHAVESLETSISFSTTAYAGINNDSYLTYPQGSGRY